MADRRAVLKIVADFANMNRETRRAKKELEAFRREVDKTGASFKKLEGSDKPWGKMADAIRDDNRAVKEHRSHLDDLQDALPGVAQAYDRAKVAARDHADVTSQSSRTLVVHRDKVRDVGREHDGLRKQVSGSGGAVGGFIGMLRRWADGLGSVGKEARDVRAYMAGLMVPAAVALLGNLVAIIAALAGGLTSLVGPLSQVVSLLGALPAGIMAVVAGAGTLFASFKGMGAALQAMNKVWTESNSNSARSAKERADAADGLVDAQRGLSDALWNEKKAEEAVTIARREARYALQDLRMEADRNAISQQRAQLSLVDAQRRVEMIQRGLVAATDTEYANALLDVQDAQLGVVEAQREGARNATALQIAEKKGVDNANSVIDAQHALASAINGVSDARRALDEATRVAAAGSSSIYSAQQQALEAIQHFSPAGKAFVKLLFSMRKQVMDLRTTAQEATLPGLGEAVVSLSRAFPQLQQILAETGPVIAAALKSVADGRWVDQLAASVRPNLPVLSDLGDTLRNVLNIMSDLAIAAAPAMRWMSDAMRRWTGIAAEATQTGLETGKLTNFFQRAVAQAQRLGHIFSNLFKIIFYVATGGSSLGNELLQSWSDVTDEMVVKVRTNQDAIRAYFNDMRPLLAEIGHLFRALGRWFIELGGDASGATTGLVKGLREQLLPAIQRLVDAASKSFGKALIDFLTAAVDLFTFFSKSGGQFTIFLEVLTEAAKLLGKFLKIPVIRQLGAWYFAILGAKQALELLVKLGIAPAIGLALRFAAVVRTAWATTKLWTAASLLAEAGQLGLLSKISAVVTGMRAYLKALLAGKTAVVAAAAAETAITGKLVAHEAAANGVGKASIFATIATKGFGAALKALGRSTLILIAISAALFLIQKAWEWFQNRKSPEERLADARAAGLKKLQDTIKQGGDVQAELNRQVASYRATYEKEKAAWDASHSLYGGPVTQEFQGMSPEEFKASLLKRPDIATYLELPGVFRDNVDAAQFFANAAGKSLDQFKMDLEESLAVTGPGARAARAEVFAELAQQVKDYTDAVKDNFTSAAEVLDQFSGTKMVNIDKVQKALDDQIKQYEEYDSLLSQLQERAKKKGIDISPFEEVLASKGIEGLGLLKAAAGASDKDLKKLVGGMKKVDEGAQTIADAFEETVLPALEAFINSLREIYDLKPISLKVLMDASEAAAVAEKFRQDLRDAGLDDWLVGKMSSQAGREIGAAAGQYHSGGVVGDAREWASGPRLGDEVDARLRRGEYVVNAQATRENFDLLQAINAGRRKFHLGGFVDTLRSSVEGAGGTKVMRMRIPSPWPPKGAYPGLDGGSNGATAAATAAFGWTKKAFPSISGNLGVGHKYIGDTGALSQHGFGNALDLFGDAREMARLFVTAIKQARLLHLRTAIFDMMSWQNSADGSRAVAKPYSVPSGGSTHKDHVHLDFWPKMPTSAPTAAPGVKPPVTALGGVVTSRQTRVVGEAGPEAIIPLPRFFEGLRKSLAPLPSAQASVARPSAAPQKIELTLEVDGAVLTRTVEIHGRRAKILLGDRRARG